METPTSPGLSSVATTNSQLLRTMFLSSAWSKSRVLVAALLGLIAYTSLNLSLVSPKSYLLDSYFKFVNARDVGYDAFSENFLESKTENNATHGKIGERTKNHSAWCPNATCMNSDVCFPCNRRFLIIIASGRSGSTTLTYMMDSLPGVRMSGENNNQLKALKLMVENIRFNPNFIIGDGKKHAWGHNSMTAGAYACPVQHMIEAINPPVMRNGRVLEDDSNTIVGFKTIRFVVDADENHDKKLVAFVQEMFPCSRIIVNIRSDTESLRNSRANTFHSNPALGTLQAETRRLRNVASMFGDSAFLLDSTKWTADVSYMNEVLAWLGFDKSCYFTELLEFNTKGDGNQAGRTNIALDPNCKYTGSS